MLRLLDATDGFRESAPTHYLGRLGNSLSYCPSDSDSKSNPELRSAQDHAAGGCKVGLFLTDPRILFRVVISYLLSQPRRQLVRYVLAVLEEMTKPSSGVLSRIGRVFPCVRQAVPVCAVRLSNGDGPSCTPTSSPEVQPLFWTRILLIAFCLGLLSIPTY